VTDNYGRLIRYVEKPASPPFQQHYQQQQPPQQHYHQQQQPPPPPHQVNYSFSGYQQLSGHQHQVSCTTITQSVPMPQPWQPYQAPFYAPQIQPPPPPAYYQPTTQQQPPPYYQPVTQQQPPPPPDYYQQTTQQQTTQQQTTQQQPVQTQAPSYYQPPQTHSISYEQVQERSFQVPLPQRQLSPRPRTPTGPDMSYYGANLNFLTQPSPPDEVD
jgi:hypothetical protein